MAMGSTQPLVKMSTGNIPGGEGGRCEADLTTFMCRMPWKSGSLNLLKPSGPHWACYGTPLTLMIVANGIDSLATTENGRTRCRDKAMSARTGLWFDVLTAVSSQDYNSGLQR